MFVAVGMGFALGRDELQLRRSRPAPGPGYFPFGLGVLMAMLGAVVLFKALTIETEGGDPVGDFAWRPLALIIVGTVVLFGWRCRRLGMVDRAADAGRIAALAGDEFQLGRGARQRRAC